MRKCLRFTAILLALWAAFVNLNGQSRQFGVSVTDSDFIVGLLNQYLEDSVDLDPELLRFPYHYNAEAKQEQSQNIPSWTQWSVAENYTFDKNRGSLSMINDLRALHPFFRDKVQELIRQCSLKNINLAVVETFRTHAKQNEYKSMGRGYTNSAGGKSKHQYGLAVDVVPVVNGKPVWDNKALWLKVGIIGEKLGLRWGGRWKKPYDPAHFEWTAGLTSGQLAAGMLPPIPEGEYPCLHEDIEELRLFWREWETTQSSVTRL